MDNSKEVISSFCFKEETPPTQKKQNLRLKGNPSVTRSLVEGFIFLEGKYRTEFSGVQSNFTIKLVWMVYFPGLK